jgi:hypothetical protein
MSSCYQRGKAPIIHGTVLMSWPQIAANATGSGRLMMCRPGVMAVGGSPCPQAGALHLGNNGSCLSSWSCIPNRRHGCMGGSMIQPFYKAPLSCDRRDPYPSFRLWCSLCSSPAVRYAPCPSCASSLPVPTPPHQPSTHDRDGNPAASPPTDGLVVAAPTSSMVIVNASPPNDLPPPEL